MKNDWTLLRSLGRTAGHRVKGAADQNLSVRRSPVLQEKASLLAGNSTLVMMITYCHNDNNNDKSLIINLTTVKHHPVSPFFLWWIPPCTRHSARPRSQRLEHQQAHGWGGIAPTLEGSFGALHESMEEERPPGAKCDVFVGWPIELKPLLLRSSRDNPISSSDYIIASYFVCVYFFDGHELGFRVV
jgi:hypothetical protein